MTCATCGKEGCHPNYHKPIAQIIEAKPMSMGCRVAEPSPCCICGYDNKERLCSHLSGEPDTARFITLSYPRCSVCGSETVLEIGRVRRACLLHPDHTP